METQVQVHHGPEDDSIHSFSFGGAESQPESLTVSQMEASLAKDNEFEAVNCECGVTVKSRPHKITL